MTERERWIVYPLLFAAIGMGFRDRMFPRANFEAERITCGELIAYGQVALIDEDGRALTRLATGPNGGHFQANQILCDELISQRRVVVIDENQQTRVGMAAGPNGGSVQVLGADGNLRVGLAADPSGQFGEITTFAGENLPMARIDTTEFGTRLLLFNHDATEPREPMAKIDAFATGSNLVLRDQALDPRAALFAVDQGGLGVVYDPAGGVHPMLTVTVKQRPEPPAGEPTNPPPDLVPPLDQIPTPSPTAAHAKPGDEAKPADEGASGDEATRDEPTNNQDATEEDGATSEAEDTPEEPSENDE